MLEVGNHALCGFGVETFEGVELFEGDGPITDTQQSGMELVDVAFEARSVDAASVGRP